MSGVKNVERFYKQWIVHPLMAKDVPVYENFLFNTEGFIREDAENAGYLVLVVESPHIEEIWKMYDKETGDWWFVSREDGWKKPVTNKPPDAFRVTRVARVVKRDQSK